MVWSRRGTRTLSAILLSALLGCSGAGTPSPGNDSGVEDLVDAGRSDDAGAEADAGVEADAGDEADAGVGVDAGVGTDAGVRSDAGVRADGGSTADGGTDAGVGSPTLWVDGANSAASDTNPGTAALPFKTISKAAAVARAGDFVLVKSGTYRERVTVANSGAPGNPIRFEAQGAVTVIPPTVGFWVGGIMIRGRTDIVLRGFTVEDSYFGIQVDERVVGTLSTPSERIVLVNNKTRSTASSGIRVAFSKNVTVEGNVVEKANYGGQHEMISIIGTDGFLVIGNEVFNGVWLDGGIPVTGKEGIDAKDDCRNGKIVGNHVHDLTRLGIYVDAWAPVRNIEVTGNLVHGCANGIALSSEGGGEVSTVLVSNNIVYGNDNYGIVLSDWAADGPRRDITIVNNTVFGNGLGGIIFRTLNAQGITLRNNISAGPGPRMIHANDPSVITLSEENLIWGGTPGNVSVGVVSGDPAFIAPDAGNFALGPTSAALDRGVTLPEVPVDAVGTPRPQGSGYDLGALERIP